MVQRQREKGEERSVYLSFYLSVRFSLLISVFLSIFPSFSLFLLNKDIEKGGKLSRFFSFFLNSSFSYSLSISSPSVSQSTCFSIHPFSLPLFTHSNTATLTFMCAYDHIYEVHAVADVVQREPQKRTQIVKLPEHRAADDHDPVVEKRCRHYKQPLKIK